MAGERSFVQFGRFALFHARLNPFGYHIAIQLGRISGIAVWPRGPWPKAPLIYWWSK